MPRSTTCGARRHPVSGPALLRPQLEACRSGFEASADAALVRSLHRSLDKLDRTGFSGGAVKAGDLAPGFTLPDQRGARISLAELLHHGPAVISFFLGTGCRFCALELRALAEAIPEIERLGATVVGVSPHVSDTIGDAGLPFRILEDWGCEVASRYGLAFRLPRELRAAYAALGCPTSAGTRAKSWLLPIPATYVVDTGGRIVVSYVDADYTTRLEPSEIIVALTGLRARSTPRSRHTPRK